MPYLKKGANANINYAPVNTNMQNFVNIETDVNTNINLNLNGGGKMFDRDMVMTIIV